MDGEGEAMRVWDDVKDTLEFGDPAGECNLCCTLYVLSMT